MSLATLPDRPSSHDDPWSEVLTAWAIALALVWAAWRFLPEAAAPFAATALWVGIPVAAHLLRGRSLEEAGFAFKNPARTVKLVAIYSAVFLPLFAVGFFAWSGRAGWTLPGAEIALVSFLGNLFFAAIPEEAFWRGFVQPRLAAAGSARPARRVLGIPLTRPIVWTAVLFAVTHVAFLDSPFSLQALERLSPFFPGLLFGALREETGD